MSWGYNALNKIMISKKSTFFLGIFIFFIPFLGLPTSWKTSLIVISGLTLISLSVKITIPKKTSKSRIKREKVTPVFAETAPIYPKDNTIEKSILKENTPEAEIK